MITQNYQTVSGAYGRDYTSGKAAEADFRAGKDFVLRSINGEGYVSVSDFAPGVTVNIRYRRDTQVKPVKTP